MRRLALLLALAACKSGSAAGGADEVTVHTGTLATDDIYKPSYDKSELGRALAAERTAEIAAEQRVKDLADGDYDQLRIAIADLAVRRRFIASLAACEANGVVCPPRLDEPAWSYDAEANVDPKLDTKLRFDLESWQKVSAELHGRACACRTLACVDSMFGAIDRLETRPMPDVVADDAASWSILRARECLYRLRGLRATPRSIALE
ncbi:MAG TPA: hypothetical protein VIV11_29745 [Kofleriaceae bacterium]